MTHLIKCENSGCEIMFSPSTHNQKYHSAECCRIATNRRIMEKYYDKRDQRKGKIRHCSECNVTKLSRYNDGKVCNGCKAKQHVAANRTVADMLLSISWQPQS